MAVDDYITQFEYECKQELLKENLNKISCKNHAWEQCTIQMDKPINYHICTKCGKITLLFKDKINNICNKYFTN